MKSEEEVESNDLPTRKGTPSELRCLLRALVSPDPEVRSRAAQELMWVSPRQLLDAGAGLDDEDRELQHPFDDAGSPAAEEAATMLAAALEDEQWLVRTTCAWALGELGPVAFGAVPALTAALTDRCWLVRGVSKHALRRILHERAESGVRCEDERSR